VWKISNALRGRGAPEKKCGSFIRPKPSHGVTGKEKNTLKKLERNDVRGERGCKLKGKCVPSRGEAASERPAGPLGAFRKNPKKDYRARRRPVQV